MFLLCMLNMYCQGGNVNTGDRASPSGDKVIKVLLVSLFEVCVVVGW